MFWQRRASLAQRHKFSWFFNNVVVIDVMMTMWPPQPDQEQTCVHNFNISEMQTYFSNATLSLSFQITIINEYWIRKNAIANNAIALLHITYSKTSKKSQNCSTKVSLCPIFYYYKITKYCNNTQYQLHWNCTTTKLSTLVSLGKEIGTRIYYDDEYDRNIFPL